eukprot:gnl/MRDRNA2_/MRDRNA2_30211_c0_seq2.p1 gnl/MRDRNA2_/MRDRNA2_30211_c0~~gnl/MRDRNA2_/MRDRNA2_30211_c0_seq2.p1  ORF type:complete len:139 (+),score=41.02 gnl/MRDRNA2_/MRDRNA2_30211_c0_seq2:86-502(+)
MSLKSADVLSLRAFAFLVIGLLSLEFYAKPTLKAMLNSGVWAASLQAQDGKFPEPELPKEDDANPVEGPVDEYLQSMVIEVTSKGQATVQPAKQAVVKPKSSKKKVFVVNNPLGLGGAVDLAAQQNPDGLDGMLADAT